MNAAILRAGEIVVDETPIPTPGPGQVLVRNLVCGVCGSDLHFVHHAPHVAQVFERVGAAFPIDAHRDIVMGHEFCGELLERGSGPDALPAGTRVCSVPFTIENGCAIEGIGFSAERPGGYGRYMALNEALLVPVPNGLAPEAAALTEPMSVGWHAIRRARVTKDDVALVVGCGPIGLAVVAALKVAGIHPIVAADFNPHRRAVALAMGADIVVDPAERSPYEDWAALARPDGFDPRSVEAIFRVGAQPRPTVVFECVGTPGMIQRVCEGSPVGSRVVVVGVCMEPDRFEPLYALTKELDLLYAFFYEAAEFAQSMHHIAEGLIDVAPMMGRTVGLDRVAETFRELEGGSDDIKVLVDPWA